MPLKVIGVGFPRTGTLSLKLALEQLGFGPCHHMIEILQHPEQALLWGRKFGGESLDWDEVFAGYASTTDAPSCFFYKELAARYPDAKLVLSTRSAESWWQSAQATVMSAENRERMMHSPNAALMAPMFQQMREYLSKRPGSFPDPENADAEQAITAFNRHNEGARREFSPGRLLVFEAKEGWEPLCGFLDVPVPDIPYPRANSREEFSQVASLGRADTNAGR